MEETDAPVYECEQLADTQFEIDQLLRAIYQNAASWKKEISQAKANALRDLLRLRKQYEDEIMGGE